MKLSQEESLIALVTREKRSSWEKASEAKASNEDVAKIAERCDKISPLNDGKVSIRSDSLKEARLAAAETGYFLKIIPE